MKPQEEVVARLRARQAGRAVLTRSTKTLAPDPDVTIGIVGIRVVTEDHIQALAFGRLDSNPQVITRENPLSRDSSDLQPFADWLCRQVARATGTGGKLRVWLPHRKTLEMLAVFGRRYERNQTASASLRQAGLICRLLAEEAEHEGNQIVVVGHDALLAHGVTGQQPIEDTHPATVVTWFNPPKGRPVAEVAAERSILPASGILPNIPGRKDDDRVERLRKELKNARRGQRQLRSELRSILDRAVRQEWELLFEQKRIFEGLDCGALLDEDEYEASMARFSWRFSVAASSPKHEMAISSEIVERAYAHRTKRHREILSDPQVREREKRDGRVVVGTVIRISQPKSNRHPCLIVLATRQQVIRFRRDDKVKSIGSTRTGRVRRISFNAATSATEIVIEIENGVRGAESLLRAQMEWFEADDFPLFLQKKVLTQTKGRNNWIVARAGNPPAAPAINGRVPGSLMAAADALRSRP